MFKLKSIGTFAAAAITVSVVGSANAASVLFVDNEVPDGSWQTLIEGAGHTYTLFDTGSFNLSLNNQASIDYVEGFDVIVMSGSNPAFNAVRGSGATWNTLSTPMVNLNNFLPSGQFGSASWQWTTPTTGSTANDGGVVDVLAPADLVFTGISLTPGTPETVDLFDGAAGHLVVTGGDTLLPGIDTVAVQSGNNDRVAVAYAPAGTLRAGSQEQYFFAGMTGGSGNPVTFSADGELAFTNAIGVLSGEIIPEPASLALLSVAGLALVRRRRA